MRVYFLATDLYHHMDTITHNSDELQLIKDYSLVHDLAEVVTGDLASNVKELISQKDPAILKTIEAKVLADIHPEAAGLHRSITGSYPEAIVKLCDLIEAYQYLEEWGSNSDFTHQVLGSLRLRLCDYTVKFKGAFPARD